MLKSICQSRISYNILCIHMICIHKHTRRVKNEVTHTRHIEGKRQNKVLALYSTRAQLPKLQPPCERRNKRDQIREP